MGYDCLRVTGHEVYKGEENKGMINELSPIWLPPEDEGGEQAQWLEEQISSRMCSLTALGIDFRM